DLTVMLAVDVSASMDFGTTTQTKRELAVEFAASAALLAAQGGDRAGLIAYTDRVELFIPPKRGKRHVYNLLTALTTVKPKGKRTDIAAPAELLIRALKTRSTLFWVSDFTEACLEGGRLEAGLPALPALKALSKRHELVPVVPTDRREQGLPAGAGLAGLIDPETGVEFLVDLSSPDFIKAFGSWRDEQDKGKKALFNSLKAEPVWLATGASPVTALARYFHRHATRRR
ncbi:MAG: VWA domain-containing protein, partial [Nitrospirota bacterium]